MSRCQICLVELPDAEYNYVSTRLGQLTLCNDDAHMILDALAARLDQYNKERGIETDNS